MTIFDGDRIVDLRPETLCGDQGIKLAFERRKNDCRFFFGGGK